MAQVTTFNQAVGKEYLRIAVPVTRVTKIMDKVDLLIDEGKLKQAMKVLQPFVIVEKKTRKIKEKTVSAVAVASTQKGAKKEAALALIAKLKEHGRDRSKIIAQLQHDLQMSYANARHYVVNVSKL